MDPKILLIVGALGLVGCLVLLFMGFRMLQEERRAKEAGPAPAPAKVEPPAAVLEAPALEAAAAEIAPPAASPAAQPSAAAAALADGMARLTAGVRARMPRGAAAGSAHEVLRVLRDNLTGRLVIELGGQRFTNLADILDPDLRQALQTIVGDLASFQSEAPAAEPLRVTLPPTSAEDAAALPERAPEAPLTSRPAGMPPSTPAGVPAPLPSGESRTLPKPTMNPFKQMAVLREMSKFPPAPTLTIAEQIDAVLQDHIRSTPLVARGIRVRPGPRGDAVFDLDGESYTGVEALPDEEVRVVVRAAIAEWEGQQ